MSEYQRYEFMTCDRPLTRTQLDAVNTLSSHIAASSTHALIEYHWGDFKHDPINVLHNYFDGFLYWANWGTPRLAFRFPHGTLPADLLKNYDYDEHVTFTRHSDYNILDIHFSDTDGPDEVIEYELGSLIAIREELIEGDLRALYIAWLAVQNMIGIEEEEPEWEEGEKGEDYEIAIPPVPPAFGKLTAAQQELANLLYVPQELLDAAAQHSPATMPSKKDNFAAWVELLPDNRRKEYLVRLARNEPGLSRTLITELRKLGQDRTGTNQPEGERVPYATLLAESQTIEARRENERREQEEQARQRHLQGIHASQDTYWHQVEQAASRGTSTGYDDAVRTVVQLREAAEYFNEMPAFQDRFRTWARLHLRRPALMRRLQEQNFTLPQP